MDAATIAATLISAKSQATGSAIATTMLKQQSQQDAALANMLGAALENGQAMQAAAAPGTGGLLDVTY